jgi:hypothetical protein
MQISFDTCPEELDGWRKFFQECGLSHEEIVTETGNTEITVLVDDDPDVARAIVARLFGR